MRNEVAINHYWEDFVDNGSRNAFYKLYEHYHAYLNFLGLKKGFNTETVKDIINDVFLYCWERKQQLQHIRHPHNYLVTFFVRSLYKLQSQPTLRSITDAECDQYEVEELAEPSFEENIFTREREQLILRLINRQMQQLPPRQREIIYQKFYLGLSYDEIARTGNVSVNTVYNTVYAAMDKLRVLLPKNSLISMVSSLVPLFSIIFLK